MRSNVRLLFIYYEYLFYVYFGNEWNIMDTKKWNGILFVILMYSFIIFYRKRYIENLLEIFLQISTKNKDIRAVFRNGRIEIETCLITNKKENPSIGIKGQLHIASTQNLSTPDRHYYLIVSSFPVPR